jgi:hypothetical protein
MKKVLVLGLLALALFTAVPASSLLAEQNRSNTLSADGGNGSTYGKGGG